MSEEKINAIHKVTETSIHGFFKDYRWLSNFCLKPVVFEGLEYSSNEHAYQAAKALDLECRYKISLMRAGEAKAIGRFLDKRPNWEDIKVDIMTTINFEKYSRHLDLRQKLLITGKLRLEETNYWGDKFYGVYEGEGKNILGKMLMNIRAFWRNAEIIKLQSKEV